MTIKPEVVDKDDVEMLQDLIISAINEAMADVEKTTEEEMNKITGGVARRDYSDKMADNNALPLVILAEQFAKLPGIGMKTAQRLAYAVMSMSDNDAKEFADAIISVKMTWVIVLFVRILQNLKYVLSAPMRIVTVRSYALLKPLRTFQHLNVLMNTEADIMSFTDLFHLLTELVRTISE